MSKQKDSTLAALLKEKPKRGRPPSQKQRQTVSVALSAEHRNTLAELARATPADVKRTDVPDLAIYVLDSYLDQLRRAVSDRNREIPEGVTDMESLYLLWDIPLPGTGKERRWTTIRITAQRKVELGRAHGMLKALFGANRSDVFGLCLDLLARALREVDQGQAMDSGQTLQRAINNILLSVTHK